jgi:hypothetical protein
MVAVMPRTVLPVVVALVCLASGAEALASRAAPADRPQIRLNAADQAAARAAVLRRGDVGSGWAGGAAKPDLSSAMACPGYRPKQSDLVVTGAAEAHYRHTVVDLRSAAEVLQTRSMVARDWRRTVVDPRATRCLRRMLTKRLTPEESLVSFRRLAFPRLARYAAAYRTIVAVEAQGRRVLMLFDLVLLGRSRTELTLSVVAPAAMRASISRAEVRLARGLLARVRA